MRPWNHRSAVWALTLSLALPGCANLPWGSRAHEAPREDVLIRPWAPAEYDVIVALQFEQAGQLAEALAAFERAVVKDPDSAYLQRKPAEALLRQNRLKDGIEHAERAYELAPDDPATRVFLGQLYRLRRSPAAAEPLLVDADGQPLNVDSAVLLYEIYMDSARHDDALRMAEWLEEAEPGSIRSRLSRAAVYDALDRPEESERVLQQAIEDEPDNLAVYVALARSRRERGDSAGEIAVYEMILERSPTHHAALVALSDAQLKADDRAGATATLERIGREHPDDLRSRVRLGFMHYEDRRYADAVANFESALAANPEEYEIIFFLGIAQRRSGQGEAAIATFQSIPADNQHYADSRTQIAAMYERQEKFAEARAEVLKAMAVEPSQELELYAATLSAKAGDFDGAVKQLEALHAAEPDDDEPLYNLGVIYGEARRTDESIAYMRRALELNPDNASALNYIGYTWAERGINLDEAESLIEQAITLRPEDGYIADSLGWVFYMRARPLVKDGDHSAARGYIEQALEALAKADDLTGGDPVVSEHIGDTYLLQGDKQRALDMFEEALQLEPRFGEQPDLLQKLEDLRRELR